MVKQLIKYYLFKVRANSRSPFVYFRLFHVLKYDLLAFAYQILWNKVVAQLAECLPLTLEVRSSNPDIAQKSIKDMHLVV